MRLFLTFKQEQVEKMKKKERQMEKIKFSSVRMVRYLEFVVNFA